MLENWQDKVFANKEALAELQTKLDEVWEAWCTKYGLEVPCYRFEDVQEHEGGDVDDDDESDKDAEPSDGASA